MCDDEIRASIEANQLRLMRERGIDMAVLSPRAAGMGHHVGDEATSLAWTVACNDLVARVVAMFPQHFTGVRQLPQSPGAPIANSIRELERCVLERGFVGATSTPIHQAATGRRHR